MRDHEDTEIGRATAPGAQANTKAPERATVEAPARSSTEIRGDAGRTATCVPPERASLAPPSDETTGAPASGQAKLAAPERARATHSATASPTIASPTPWSWTSSTNGACASAWSRPSAS